MAEGLVEPPSSSSSSKRSPDEVDLPPPSDSLFQRRISFHLERKPYSSISTSGGSFNLETLNPTAPFAAAPVSASAETRLPGAGKRSDGGLDPELSFEINFRRIGAGLANLGNTCFLNSVLQCLTYTQPFAAYLQSGKHKSSCRTHGFCALCALQNHVMSALQSTGKILSPSHLVKNLRSISRNFRNSRQEDAHEYMVNLLESMHKCCLPSGVPTESSSAYEKSLVHKIFGGHLRSQVECMQCKFCSNKFDPFLDLSLEIVKADSLRKALAHFTNVELLDGGERQYQCQRCKQKVKATKRLTVHKPPHVLTVHLKRFSSDIPGQKIDKKVEFGPTLDLKPFVSDQHEDLKYTLYGVLVHAGWSTHSGHYYCFVRTSSGMWHSLDDNKVLQVSEKTVLAQKAYMLFYVRDRSSASKGLLGVARKNNATYAPGKVNSRIPFVMSGVHHSGVMERISSISKSSLAIPKSDDDSHSQTGFAMTVRDSLSKETSSLQKNVNNIRREAPLLENSSLAMGGASCLQTDTCSYKALQQTTLSTDPTKQPPQGPSTLIPLSTSSSDHSSHLENNGVAETSHVDNVILKPESSQNSNGKSQLPDFLNGKMSSGIITAHLDNPSPLKLRSEERNMNPLEQIGILVNGSAINGISQRNDASCKIGTITTSANIEPLKVFSQSIHLNGHIQKDPLSIKPTEHQTTGSVNYELMTNLQHDKGGEKLLNSKESGQINKYLNTPTHGNVYLQKDCFSVNGRKNTVGDCSQAKEKPKKLVKSLIKGPYLGRNLLFLKSLQLRKSKKSKKYRKHYVNSKKLTKHKDDLTLGDHGASTSEAARLVGIDSVRSSKKRSRESSNNGNDIKGVKDVTYSTGNFVPVNVINVESSSKYAGTPATSEQPKDSVKPAGTRCDAKGKDACNKSPARYSDLSRLMSIKETIVPRWDDIEVQESDGFRGAQSSSIGYVLDEWDEEYDMGKRKKINKSKRNFGGPNPFQEHANMKIQENTKTGVNQMYSGNQPLRI